MSVYTDMITNLNYTAKLYDRMGQSVCTEFLLTRTEMDVLAFLANNPEKDTARDIVELRMIPKANVSQAVELLMHKNLLTRRQDTQDRRKIHLSLTEAAAAPVVRILSMQRNFFSVLFNGFSEAEQEQYFSLNKKIAQNAANARKGNLNEKK